MYKGFEIKKKYLSPLFNVPLMEKCPTTMNRIGEGPLAHEKIKETWKEEEAMNKMG